MRYYTVLYFSKYLEKLPLKAHCVISPYAISLTNGSSEPTVSQLLPHFLGKSSSQNSQRHNFSCNFLKTASRSLLRHNSCWRSSKNWLPPSKLVAMMTEGVRHDFQIPSFAQVCGWYSKRYNKFEVFWSDVLGRWWLPCSSADPLGASNRRNDPVVAKNTPLTCIPSYNRAATVLITLHDPCSQAQRKWSILTPAPLASKPQA